MTITKKYLRDLEQSARIILCMNRNKLSLNGLARSLGRMNGRSRTLWFKFVIIYPAAIGKSSQLKLKKNIFNNYGVGSGVALFD